MTVTAAIDDPCRLCQQAEADPDSLSGLCRQCEMEMQLDAAEEAEAERIRDRMDEQWGRTCTAGCGYCGACS